MVSADAAEASSPSGVAANFLELLHLDPPHDAMSPKACIDSLKRLVLLDGLPSGEEATLIRPLVWKLLLRLHVMPPAAHADSTSDSEEEPLHPLLDPAAYHRLSTKPASPMFNKIRNDTFRTLATDQEFRGKVGEERLIKCLETFVWRQLDVSDSDVPSPGTITYVQGMNVLAAPFLYVLPSEIEAFACFSAFIEAQAPRYVRPTLDGVHAGLHLVDQCLRTLDPTLYGHLLSCNLTAELYAFPSLLTFSACTPPLDAVLELWDFLLAWGVGLNVLCVVAQLWIMRTDLLSSSSPMKLLRTFPPLRTRDIIPLAVQFVADCPPELFDAVMRHPWDDSLVLQA